MACVPVVAQEVPRWVAFGTARVDIFIHTPRGIQVDVLPRLASSVYRVWSPHLLAGIGNEALFDDWFQLRQSQLHLRYYPLSIRRPLAPFGELSYGHVWARSRYRIRGQGGSREEIHVEWRPQPRLALGVGWRPRLGPWAVEAQLLCQPTDPDYVMAPVIPSRRTWQVRPRVGLSYWWPADPWKVSKRRQRETH